MPGPDDMPDISVDSTVLTLVNTFVVAPDRADELMTVLVNATDEVMQHIPGFISASLHMATDRTRVVNYAQWTSREAFNAMLQREDARQHMGQAAAIAERFDPVLCRAVHVVQNQVG